MITFRRRLFFTAIVLLLLGVMDFGLTRIRVVRDLTAEHSQTLTEESLEVVRKVREPVRINVFFARGDPDRVNAASLLLRYRQLNRRIDFRLIDPETSPSEAQRFGINPVFGGIAVVAGDRTERAQTPTEQDITAALARLIRGKPTHVCLTKGHGETDPESTVSEGFAATVVLLQRNGYETEVIDLLTNPSVPSGPGGCQALIIASPQTAFGESEKRIAEYLDQTGRAVILTDPSSTADLNPLLEPFGLAIERGVVLEGDSQSRFPDDPTRPVVFDYRPTHPITRRMPPTFYPGSQALVVTDETMSGLVVSPLARTSDDSYLEREPLEPSFDSERDIPGPIAVAAAADLSANVGGEVLRTRIVVFGDVDFATNAFVGQAGNSTMLIRALDWVILEEDLVTVSANLPRVRPIDLTEGRIAYARFLLAGVVPGLFLLAGGAVWAIRRSR